MKNTDNTIKISLIFLSLGVVFTIISPYLFIQNSNIFDFTKSGQIGDTIGGITSPILNILGDILIFLALKSQLDSNLELKIQIERQDKQFSMELESKEINQLYDNLKSSVDDFAFIGLNPKDFGNKDFREVYGSEAICLFFKTFYSSYHGNDEEMECNPKITEIISMLEICEKLLLKINLSKIPDKENLFTLTKHQFLYRIFPGISHEYHKELKPYYCDLCKRNHGLPIEMVRLIKSNYELAKRYI